MLRIPYLLSLLVTKFNEGFIHVVLKELAFKSQFLAFEKMKILIAIEQCDSG